MGARFDIVITGYILLPVYLVLSILFILNKRNKVILKFLFYYVFAIFFFSFLVSTADIPYFKQFFTRFSISAFKWMDSPLFVIKMIFQEPRYWISIIPFLILIYIFFIVLKRIWRNIYQAEYFHKNYLIRSGISVLFLGFILLGIRGRIDEKSPIRIGTAYFSNNPFLNQLGLNPNFTLVRSFLDVLNEENNSIKLMNDSTAVSNVQKYFNISNPDSRFPLLRKITYDSAEGKKYNIVLIIMESMSANKMKRNGNLKNLTPFLDSISQRGLYFENIYSSGLHTFNGIYSTLFSYPAIFRQHPMKESSIFRYNGIASTLKDIGYSTVYFTTHDGQFDNVEGFLKANDFDKVISKQDYPAEKVKSTLGVPDDYMFEFSIPVLNKMAASHQPFFASFMTVSDHGPYYIPDYFKPHNSEITDQIVEYADWSLNKFILLSSQQKWFESTIFVFVADHGSAMDGTYEMPLSFNHVPLLFYNPKLISDGKTFDCLGGQIDVFPTIMGLLNQSYINNTLGCDLLKEKRPYIYFNGDDKYGVIDHEWFLIVRNDNSHSLYKYVSKDTRDYSLEHPDIVMQMKEYAESNLQTFQYVILNGKQDCK